MISGKPTITKAIAFHDLDEYTYNVMVLWNNKLDNIIEQSYVEIHMIVDRKEKTRFKENIYDTGDTFRFDSWGIRSENELNEVILNTYNDIGLYQSIEIPVRSFVSLPKISPKNVLLQFLSNSLNITWDNLNNSEIFCYSILISGINPQERQTFILNSDATEISIPYPNYQIKHVIINVINNIGGAGEPFLYDNPNILSYPQIYPQTLANTFRFIAWGDSRDSGTSVNSVTLANESILANSLNPNFTVFSGDLCGSWSTSCTTGPWKTAINGNNTNTLYDKTFVIRGNHDGDTSNNSQWQSIFNFGPPSDTNSISYKVGATNYSALTTDLTYSFDYGNSHFICVDLTNGGDCGLTTTQLQWIDSDLTAAEQRPGIIHTFIFWHGPIYDNGDGHSGDCGCDKTVYTVCPYPPTPTGWPNWYDFINRHPIIAATFHGHEHLVDYAHITNAEIPGLTHEFETFIAGAAAPSIYGISSYKRVDYSLGDYGFCSIDVNNSGNTYTVNIYRLSTGTVAWSKTFTHGTVGCINPTCEFNVT